MHSLVTSAVWGKRGKYFGQRYGVLLPLWAQHVLHTAGISQLWPWGPNTTSMGGAPGCASAVSVHKAVLLLAWRSASDEAIIEYKWMKQWPRFGYCLELPVYLRTRTLQRLPCTPRGSSGRSFRRELSLWFLLTCSAQTKFRFLILEEVPAVCINRTACLTPVGLWSPPPTFLAT